MGLKYVMKTHIHKASVKQYKCTAQSRVAKKIPSLICSNNKSLQCSVSPSTESKHEKVPSFTPDNRFHQAYDAFTESMRYIPYGLPLKSRARDREQRRLFLPRMGLM